MRCPRRLELEVGWHRVRGGDEPAGAVLLERAGRRLFEARSFRDAIAPLEECLRIHEANGVRETTRLELRKMIVHAGVLCDRGVLLGYADSTLDALYRHSGLAATAKLRPWVGRALALFFGQLVAWALWLFSKLSRRGPRPDHALTDFVMIANFAAAARSLSYDIPALDRLVAMLEPLSRLRRRVPGASYVFLKNFRNMSLGRFAEVRRSSPQLLRVLDEDRLTPMTDSDRAMGRGGILYQMVSLESLQTRPGYERHLDRLVELDLRFFDAGTQMARLFFHRLRGEEELARAAQAEGELRAVQLGTVWIFEAQLHWISALGFGLTGDHLGLKRSLSSLERLAKAGYHFEGLVAIVRVDLAERYERAATEAMLTTLPADSTFERQWGLSVAAEAAAAGGDHERAVTWARQTLELVTEEGDWLPPSRARAHRALGKALVALGRADEARHSLEQGLAELAPYENPLFTGMLEEALASMLSQSGLRIEARERRLAARALYLSTDNPVLLARAERLARRRARPVARDPSDGAEAMTEVATSSRVDASSGEDPETITSGARVLPLGAALIGAAPSSGSMMCGSSPHQWASEPADGSNMRIFSSFCRPYFCRPYDDQRRRLPSQIRVQRA